MEKPEANEEKKDGLEVRSYFVRGKNALVTRADFGDLYVDYYLHLTDIGERYKGEADTLLKELVAAMTLHCASRPWNEMLAWTMSLQDPGLNLFVTGDNPGGRIVGRAFTEGIKERDDQLFYSDLVHGNEPRRRSVVTFEGRDPFRAVERLYEQSEQRLARFFRFGEEDFVLVTAQPGCDETWLRNLKEDEIQKLDQTQTLSLLEQRSYRWECGCSEERMLEMLSPTGIPTLFGDEETIRLGCPRCAKKYVITREVMEAYLVKPSRKSSGGK
jgi:molecular chaperone Hsp33